MTALGIYELSGDLLSVRLEPRMEMAIINWAHQHPVPRMELGGGGGSYSLQQRQEMGWGGVKQTGEKKKGSGVQGESHSISPLTLT